MVVISKGNTSHLSCTWFAAMFAVYTQHTVHVIHIVLLIRIEYRAWIAVSTAVQQYASQSSSMLCCIFSVPFPLFCCCALCVIFIFYSSSLEACLFISYWAVSMPGSFFCFEFKHNISTLRQKTTTYLTYRQTDIHFDYYSCMLSFFLCANFMTFYFYVPFLLSCFSSLSFISFWK